MALLLLCVLVVEVNCAPGEIEKVLRLHGEDRSMYIYESCCDISSMLFGDGYSYVVVNLGGEFNFTESLRRFDFYVVSCKDVNLLDRFFAIVHRTVYFSARAKVLLVFFGSDSLVKVFQVLWRYYLSNVIVVKEGVLYSYYPITEGKCLASPPKLVGNKSKLYLESSALYFRGCTFRIYAAKQMPYVNLEDYLHNTGLEIIILREMVLRLQLSPYYMDHSYQNWGRRLPNGTYTDMYKKLYNREGEVVLGLCKLDDTFLHDFDYTFPHCIAYFSFFVPLAKAVEPWKNIFRIYDYTIWICILFCTATLTLVWFIQNKQTLKMSTSFVMVLSVLVSSTSSSPKSFRLRIIFLSWSFAALVLSSSYQSVLISFLFKPSHENQIATLEQLLDSDLSFGGFHLGRDNFDPKRDEISRRVYDNFQFCSLQGFECLQRTLKQGDFALMKSVRTMNYYIVHDYSTLLYRLPTIFTVRATMYINKGSPFLDRMNEMIIRLIESGLVDHWDVYEKWKKPLPLVPIVQRITLSHVMSTFFLYVFGIVLSAIVFIVEAMCLSKRLQCRSREE